MRIEFMNSNSPSRSPPPPTNPQIAISLENLSAALVQASRRASRARHRWQRSARPRDGRRLGLFRLRRGDVGHNGDAVHTDVLARLSGRESFTALRGCEVARLRGCEGARARGHEGTRTRVRAGARGSPSRPLALSPLRPRALSPSRGFVPSCLRAFVPLCLRGLRAEG